MSSVTYLNLKKKTQNMEHFDIIVIGAGSGLEIVDKASNMGLKVALIESGPMGGTCLNRGCIPSKMLIHSADVAEIIQNADKFGIKQKGYSVNFRKIVSRVSKIVDKDARDIEKAIKADKKITVFKTEGKFVGKKTLKVGSKTISGSKIVIFAGTRPFIPPIEGIKKVKYITSTEALRLQKLPKSLTIIGGGYIAAELAHFFGSLGSKITIIQKGNALVANEDTEISRAFTEVFKKRFNVLLNHSAQKVVRKNGKFLVTAKGATTMTIKSDQLLVAVGRVPNSDVLAVEKAGVQVNKRGYVKTNDYLETTAENVWAAGDIAGKYLFKHSANLEATYLEHNASNPSEKVKVDYHAMPHAIFSSPQVAGVGLREQDLVKGTYVVGKYRYIDTGMGMAFQDNTGFAKILVDKKSGRILGCHIIGTDASTLIHEVVIAMKSGKGTIDNITNAIHAHPALSEVVQRAAGRARV